MSDAEENSPETSDGDNTAKEADPKPVAAAKKAASSKKTTTRKPAAKKASSASSAAKPKPAAAKSAPAPAAATDGPEAAPESSKEEDTMTTQSSSERVLDDDTKRSLLRLLYMAVLGFIGYFIFFALMILGGVQFLIVLINGETNDDIREAADKISTYLGRIIDFITYKSEEKPFPLNSIKD